MKKKILNGKLTVQQARTLVEITNYVARNRGNFPTFREIQELCGYASNSGVTHQLDSLVEAGFIVEEPTHQGEKRRYAVRGMTVIYPNWYYQLVTDLNFAEKTT